MSSSLNWKVAATGISTVAAGVLLAGLLLSEQSPASPGRTQRASLAAPARAEQRPAVRAEQVAPSAAEPVREAPPVQAEQGPAAAPHQDTRSTWSQPRAQQQQQPLALQQREPSQARRISQARAERGRREVEAKIAALPRRGAVPPALTAEQRVERSEMRLRSLERRESVDRAARRLRDALELDTDEETEQALAHVLGGGRVFMSEVDPLD